MGLFNLEFKPVDLKLHAESCFRFVKDTHLCSFGSFDDFGSEEEQRRLLAERIMAKLAQDPASYLHVWNKSNIVGQLNFGTFVDPAIGYLSFFYVVPLWRGTGVAAEMETFAGRHLQQRGYKSARLSVTATNIRAMRFYSKHGWNDLGPRNDQPGTHNMEKSY